VEKPSKKSKGKGKAKETETADDDVVFDENAAEEQEKITRGALFSINLIDLKEPPLPMKQGPWNKRPLEAKAVKKLKDSFKSQGVCAFDLDNALPLVLPREHLHPEAVNNSINDPETAPMLRLTDMGMLAKWLTFAGGHHRRHLILQTWETTEKAVVAMEAKLVKKKNALKTKLEKRTKAPLDVFHEEIDDLETKILAAKRSTLWTVKIYDASKCSISTDIIYSWKLSTDIMLTNDELPAHYLARNMEVVKNVEDDSQKTLRVFKEYSTLVARIGGSGGMKKWIENLGKGDQNALQVFQCKNDLRFLTILNMFGEAFHNKPEFSVKYVRENLHGLSGGVSVFNETDIILLLKQITDNHRGPRDNGEHNTGSILRHP
jgi:hypothetical protein